MKLQKHIIEKVESLPFSSNINDEDEVTMGERTWKYDSGVGISDDLLVKILSDEVVSAILDKIVETVAKHEKFVNVDIEDFDFTDSINECNRVFNIVGAAVEKSEVVLVTPLLLSIMQSATKNTYQRKRDNDPNDLNTLTLHYAGCLVNEEHDNTEVSPKVYCMISAQGIEGMVFNSDDIGVRINSIDLRDSDVTDDGVEIDIKYTVSVSDKVKVFINDQEKLEDEN